MVEEEEAVRDYEEELRGLKQNSKPQINLLTMLAEENAAHASAIAKAIHDHIFRVERSAKLPGLYLVDSIVKNYKRDDAYEKAFQRRLIPIFLHVFSNVPSHIPPSPPLLTTLTPLKVDEKGRAAMYRLRWTWAKGIWPASKLYAIDIKVHEVDGNWPVASIEPSRSSSSSEGEARTATAAAAAAPTTSPNGSTRIHVNPHFISSKASGGRRVVVPARDSPVRDPPPQRPSDRPSSSAPRQHSPGPSTAPKAASDRDPVVPSSAQGSQGPGPRDGPGDRERPRKPSRDPRYNRDPRQKRAPQGPADGPGAKVARQQAEQTGTMAHLAKAERALASSSSENGSRHGPKRRSPNSSLDSSASSIVPTPVPGGHAFLRPPGPSAPLNPVPGPAPSASSGGLPMSNGLPRGPGLLPPPELPSAALPTPAPAAPAAPMPAVAPQPPVPSKGPIPANNRIFVDGRAYEVKYIQETPVIERSGLPHKIYFSGPARDVVIDGVGHRLGFGEEKTVTIDGQAHLIRFGAPSRELYMGNFAFRGQFGGPPIRANINGQTHQISLCGPPPEVKIEPEPAHELQRFLSLSHQPQQPTYAHDFSSGEIQRGMVGGGLLPVPAQAPQPQMAPAFVPQQMGQPMGQPQSQPWAPAAAPQPAFPQANSETDLSTLLKRIKDSGVLNSLTKAPTPAQPQSGEKQQGRENTPPIKCQYGFGEDEVVERRGAPPANLKEFSIRILRSRYSSVIDSLYSSKGQRCSHCGLRFAGMTKGQEDSRFRAHLDFHFRANAAAASDERGQSRPWFLPLGQWLAHSELDEELAQETEAEAGPAEETPVPRVVMREGTEARCGVCGEELEKEWEDEEEHWVLLDAVEEGGRPLHLACRHDLSRLNSTAEDSDTGLGFLASASSGGPVGALPGLSTLKAEVKEEPLSVPDNRHDPILIDSDPIAPSEPLSELVKREAEEEEGA